LQAATKCPHRMDVESRQYLLNCALKKDHPLWL
jgi:hypothetical protein